MAKSVERLRARELRRGGESIREIAKILNISQSSASLWCRDILLTEGQVNELKRRDIVGGMIGRMKAWQTHRDERINREETYGKNGQRMVGVISRRELFLTGLGLY